MKARIDNRTVEIPDERMAKGTLPQRGAADSGGCKVSALSPSPLPGWPKPTDKWNYAYAQYLELEKQAGRIKYWWFEPIPFGITLGGAEEKLKYRPDFLVWYPDGLERKLEFVEVKGWSRNRRDGITRYKIAAALFPCFDWIMVERKGHGWQEYGA